jgi:hypothetical protein
VSILDDISETADEMVRQAGKALDQVKGRVETLQVKAQMDVAARKLGYLEFERYRDRPMDAVGRRRVLDEMTLLDDQLAQLRTDLAPEEPASPPRLTVVPPPTPLEPAQRRSDAPEG